MNKRIFELAIKSGHIVGQLPLNTNEKIQLAGLEKFAELIVRECVSKCEVVANMATITNTGEMARKTKATADSCATMIKEHFGVSE